MVVLAIFACIFLAIVMMKIVKAMMSMIDHLDDVGVGQHAGGARLVKRRPQQGTAEVVDHQSGDA